MRFSLAPSTIAPEPVATSDLLVVWAAIGIAFVLAAASLPTLVRHRRRGPAIAAAAEQAGLRYRAQDGHDLGRYRFDLLVPRGGLRWTASHVVTSEQLGSPTHAFDIRVWTEVEVDGHREGIGSANPVGLRIGTAKTRRQTRAKEASGCIVRLPINAPRVMIVQENAASKIVAAVSQVDLDLESDLFNRRYHVLTADKAFARSLLDARVLDLIVRGDGRMEFEFVGNLLLIRTPALEPGLLPGLVRYGEQFPTAISSLVRDRYPSPVVANE